jgi:hypothetical protein
MNAFALGFCVLDVIVPPSRPKRQSAQPITLDTVFANWRAANYSSGSHFQVRKRQFARRCPMIRFGSVFLFCLCVACQAHANFHLWVIDEIFSSADGSAQFIELSTTSDGQEVLAHHVLTSTLKEFELLSNLPSFNTAGHSFLFGTPAYAALPGAVPPDYTIPNNFFSVHGDTIDFASVSSVTFSDGQLPLDGHTAMNVDRLTAVNSPKNFAGAQGSVNLVAAPPWKNPILPLDINGDTRVEPVDVLVLINAINGGLTELPNPPAAPLLPPPYYDPNGDGALQPIDVLIVINFLNSQSATSPGLVASALRADFSADLRTDLMVGDAPVPEPSTLLLGSGGLAVMFVAARRRGYRPATSCPLLPDNSILAACCCWTRTMPMLICATAVGSPTTNRSSFEL